jgi:hypothetical protein
MRLGIEEVKYKGGFSHTPVSIEVAFQSEMGIRVRIKNFIWRGGTAKFRGRRASALQGEFRRTFTRGEVTGGGKDAYIFQ